MGALGGSSTATASAGAAGIKQAKGLPTTSTPHSEILACFLNLLDVKLVYLMQHKSHNHLRHYFLHKAYFAYEGDYILCLPSVGASAAGSTALSSAMGAAASIQIPFRKAS